MMPGIPRDKTLENAPALLREGYTFVSERCRRFQVDAFETRILFEPVVCMLGEEAAAVFYEPGRCTRRDAMPKMVLKLLQDEGSVAMQDGAAHRHRKAMFMSFMSPAHARRLAEEVAEQWQVAISAWENVDDVVLHHEAEVLLFRAVCRWAGIPPTHAHARTRELHAMIDGAGSGGPRNWRGHVLRRRTERWARSVVRRVRSGEIEPDEATALFTIAHHRQTDGTLLKDDVAAVELINVLRPTVAVAYYVTFVAHALHHHSDIRRRIQDGEEDLVEPFIQEVRRSYPFFPFVAGRVLDPFTWRGHDFDEGRMVLLDLYGTNHDPRSWEHPGDFLPDRFRDRTVTPFSLIPQGGGHHMSGHRCAGEWITIELMKTAARALAGSMEFDVPPQDLGISLTRMPAVPESRFIIRNVRRV